MVSAETPVNMAKWLLLALVTLPLMELAVFIAVAAVIGFAGALGLLLATSLTGGLVLRYAGGRHIARARVALSEGSFTSLQADSSGVLLLLAGILLLIPGFITDLLGLLLLVSPLRQGLAALFGRGQTQPGADGVVDLPPEQWHRVPGPVLPGQRERGNEREP